MINISQRILVPLSLSRCDEVILEKSYSKHISGSVPVPGLKTDTIGMGPGKRGMAPLMCG